MEQTENLALGAALVTGYTADEVLRAGAAAAQIKEIDGHPFLVTPDDYSITSLEEYLPNPLRKKVSLKMRDEKSFIAYFNLHGTNSSQIYGQVNPPRLVGIIDDHSSNENGWREHQVHYECPLSRQWETWLSKDGKAQSQEEFAIFIEKNLLDIVEPTAAEMLEISRSFEAKKKVDFKSAVRLDNGQVQFGYEEEIQGTAAKGTLQIPETFKIGIPVFENGTGYALECRLRYRISDAQLRMWYEIINPEKALEDAVKETWARIEEQTLREIFNAHI